MGFILKEKLKILKLRLKDWNREEYGGMEDRIVKLVEEIAELDVRGEEVLLTDVEVILRKEKFGSLWRLLRAKDSMLVQRSGSKWLKEGDANTKYFHKCIKGRVSRNHITALKVDGGWVKSPSEVKRVVVEYFSKHVSRERWERPKLDGVPFDEVSPEENEKLVAPFLEEEIDRVVKDSDGSKSPGPDGFNFAFIKEFWYLLKGEVRIMFDQFHANEVIPRGLLSYFVALIPKVSSPMEIKDFRPISLLGSLYKILSKVLAKRLSGVMDSIISKSQSAFIKGRHMVDGVLVINEVVDWAKKSNQQALILKVDFEKAYDSVDWGFLEYMMKRVGLSRKWIAWMKGCVFGDSMSVLVNGSPTVEINIEKGLKQGDPLAPFLFLLVVEGFRGLMRNVVRINMFQGLRFHEDGMILSHLQYADDTICMGKASVDNLWVL